MLKKENDMGQNIATGRDQQSPKKADDLGLCGYTEILGHVNSAETKNQKDITSTKIQETTTPQTYSLSADAAICKTTEGLINSKSSPLKTNQKLSLPAGLKPYYYDEKAGIVIFHGDCREILPNLEPVDLVLTDPPYGINGARGNGNKKRARGLYEGSFTSDMDTTEYINQVVVPVIQVCIKISKAVIVTPGNKNFSCYPQPVSFGCIYNPQGGGASHWGWVDSQPIFYYGNNPLAGKLTPCSFVLKKNDDCDYEHPCPKPITIWKKILIKGLDNGEAVLDPFMGSGTTLRAAKDLGRKAIGIEIEEKYCEIAAKRLQQEVFDFR